MGEPEAIITSGLPQKKSNPGVVAAPLDPEEPKKKSNPVVTDASSDVPHEKSNHGLLATLEKGIKEGELPGRCGRCQPCGGCCCCCRSTLEKGAIISATIFSVVGLAFTLLSLVYFIVAMSEDWSGRVFFIVLFLFVCSVFWLLASTVLMIGVVRRSFCLIRVFLWPILVILGLILLLGMLYTMIILAVDSDSSFCHKPHRLISLLQTLYFTPFVLVLFLWYPYWVVYAFYVKYGGKSCCRCP